METDVYEVIDIIKSLKNMKAMDYDYDLSVLRVKKNIEIFFDHMALLYNFSVITVTYPDL